MSYETHHEHNPSTLINDKRLFNLLQKWKLECFESLKISWAKFLIMNLKKRERSILMNVFHCCPDYFVARFHLRIAFTVNNSYQSIMVSAKQTLAISLKDLVVLSTNQVLAFRKQFSRACLNLFSKCCRMCSDKETGKLKPHSFQIEKTSA